MMVVVAGWGEGEAAGRGGAGVLRAGYFIKRSYIH